MQVLIFKNLHPPLVGTFLSVNQCCKSPGPFSWNEQIQNIFLQKHALFLQHKFDYIYDTLIGWQQKRKKVSSKILHSFPAWNCHILQIIQLKVEI